MKYSVILEQSDEGFAASVPGLPGFHSQGDTETEALENVADAIAEYLYCQSARPLPDFASQRLRVGSSVQNSSFSSSNKLLLTTAN